ncbi:MAG: hypothetical protein VST69_00215 [Nitrospirota bacterium]|nr:hypothetical protein [Nitrospirota bacterium]
MKNPNHPEPGANIKVDPIPLFMEAFGHATQQQTLAYLGIQTKETSQI